MKTVYVGFRLPKETADIVKNLAEEEERRTLSEMTRFFVEDGLNLYLTAKRKGYSPRNVRKNVENNNDKEKCMTIVDKFNQFLDSLTEQERAEVCEAATTVAVPPVRKKSTFECTVETEVITCRARLQAAKNRVCLEEYLTKGLEKILTALRDNALLRSARQKAYVYCEDADDYVTCEDYLAHIKQMYSDKRVILASRPEDAAKMLASFGDPAFIPTDTGGVSASDLLADDDDYDLN